MDVLFGKRFARAQSAERLEKLELSRQGLIRNKPFALRAKYQALELFQFKSHLRQAQGLLFALASLFCHQLPKFYILGKELFARVFVVRWIHLYKVRLKALSASMIAPVFIHKMLAFSVEKLALDLDFPYGLRQVKTPAPAYRTKGHSFQDEYQFFPFQAAGGLPGVFSRRQFESASFQPLVEQDKTGTAPYQ